MVKVGDSEQRSAWPGGKDDGLGPKWKLWRRRRYIVAILTALGAANIYALRLNLSVAIISMSSLQNVTFSNGTTVEMKEFDWDTKEVGFALSAFFYGYVTTQVFAGMVAARVGTNRLFFGSVVTTAICTLLTPIATKQDYSLLVLLRILEGMFEGLIFPSIHGLWSVWGPQSEVSTLASASYAGVYLGTVIALPTTSLIIGAFGWEAVFYIFGCVSLCWCIVWIIVVRKTPRDDPYISIQELHFIESTSCHEHKEKLPLPWKAFFTSSANWAIIIAHTTESWGFFLLSTSLPSYIRDTLHYDLEKTGFLSAIPYLGMGTVLFLSGRLADWLRPDILSTTTVRKTYGCGSFAVQIVFLFVVINSTSRSVIVTCIVAYVSTGGFSWSSVLINHLDIAPKYAAVLLGISNTCGSATGIVSPYLTGFIIQHQTAEEWNIVFYIIIAMNAVGMTAYLIWGSGELEPWAVTNPNMPIKSAQVNKPVEGLENRPTLFSEEGSYRDHHESF